MAQMLQNQCSRSRLSTDKREHPFVRYFGAGWDMPHSGNWQWGGNAHRPCRQRHGNESDESQTSLPPTRAADSLARKYEKFCEFFSRSQMVLPAVPAQFFSQKLSAHFFTVSPEIFRTLFTNFRIFFALFFTLFFALLFKQNFAQIRFTYFPNTFLQSCVAQRVSIVCSLSTAQLSPRQAIPLLVDEARHSWLNTRKNKLFKRHVFGKTSAKFSLCSNPTIIKADRPRTLRHTCICCKAEIESTFYKFTGRRSWNRLKPEAELEATSSVCLFFWCFPSSLSLADIGAPLLLQRKERLISRNSLFLDQGSRREKKNTQRRIERKVFGRACLKTMWTNKKPYT